MHYVKKKCFTWKGPYFSYGIYSICKLIVNKFSSFVLLKNVMSALSTGDLSFYLPTYLGKIIK